MNNSNLIHQTLHGYSNGHKLLASSIELENNIKNILLRESDSPGQEFHHKDNICYTGYPLVDFGYYILSKTSVDKEINRPGCVWTHSILIPFALLANKFLLESFNPHDYFLDEKNILNFNLEPIPFIENKEKNAINKDLSMVFSNVFLSENQVIMPSNMISVYDIIVMWSKLWPKLRRVFSFKTWSPKTSSNRPYYHQYDLLLNDYISINIQSDNWARAIFEDDDDIHDFLWKHGASLDKNKKNVYNLLNCWNLLENRQFDELSMFILRWKKAPVSLIKDISKKLSPNDITKSVVYLISTYILTINNKDISSEVLSEIGNLLFDIDQSLFVKILASDTEHARSMSINNVGNLPIEIITKLYNSEVYLDVDILNPKIIANNYFWENCKNKSYVFEKAIRSEEMQKIIPICSFSPYDITITNSSNQYLLKVLISNFDCLSNDWVSYILDNQNSISLQLSLLDENNLKLGCFIISNFTVENLIKFPDEVLTYLYTHSKKDKSVIYKIALLLIDNENKNHSNLICASFDDICYLTSTFELSFPEKQHLRKILRSYDLGFGFNSLRRMFIVFSAHYSKRNNIPTESLTLYNSNLFELNDVIKYSIENK